MPLVVKLFCYAVSFWCACF